MALGGSSAVPSKADTPVPRDGRTLRCELSVVQAGQFKGAHYVGSSSQGGVILTLVASAADRRVGRAVLIDGERAVVGALSVQPRQTTFVDSGTKDDSALITIFTAVSEDADIPAAYTRQSMIGSVPIVLQYAGLCRQP